MITLRAPNATHLIFSLMAVRCGIFQLRMLIYFGREPYTYLQTVYDMYLHAKNNKC